MRETSIKINMYPYCRKESLHISSDEAIKVDCLFMEDSDPCHTVKITEDLLAENGIK